MTSAKEKLFLVVLGGRTKMSNIELHDVRWVIGKSIQDTFKDLRNQWFGDLKGLHIDSYIKINYIDGYLINIKKKNSNYKNQISSQINQDTNKDILWFVNLGGYNSNNLAEQHQFGLVVAKTSFEAKRKAKNEWLKNSLLKHKDDLSCLKNIKEIDECKSIKSIKTWQIELIPDKLKRNQKFIPDWYGYMRIDKP